MTRPNYVKIVRKGFRKQKWHAQFIADNGLILASTESYTNLQDLERMLDNYFPTWDQGTKPT